MNLNQKHLISLLSYLGVGFIGGSISHGFFTGTRSIIMAAIGLGLFLIGELLHREEGISRMQTIIYGLLYSLSIGMISGGFTHFLDSPERSLWIIPAGFLISWLVYGAKHNWNNFNWKSVVLGIFTTAALFGLGRSAIRYLPASVYSELADHHNEESSQTGSIKSVNDQPNNVDTRLSSGASKTTFEFMFDGMNSLSAGKEGVIQFYPNALVGGDAIQTINDLELTHEKYIHLILIRKDGGEFLHLHPEKDNLGRRVTPVTFPSGGERYIYADLSSKQFGKQVLTDKLIIEGPTSVFTVNPIQSTGIILSQSGIDFNITRDTPNIISATNFYININSGALENYLGAKGHMVAINLADMGYSHVHPNENNPIDSFRDSSGPKGTSFMAHFEKAGTYRIFIQVQIAGVIYTLPVSVEVPEGISGTDKIGEHSH